MISIVGPLVSSIVKVAEVVVELPQSSVAVKVTVAEPLSPQPLDTAEKSLDQVTLPQVSELDAPPLEANQAFKSALFPAPSHGTVKSLAAVSILGSVVSSIVNVAVVVLEFPQTSVAVKVTVAAPVAPQRSESALKSLDQVTPLQLSDADAPPLEANQAFKAAAFPAPSHSTVLLLAAVLIVGAMVSSTVII